MNLLIEQKIGQNIKELRMQAGYTQEMLSAKLQVEGCDITRSALAKIEVGQRHLYVDELIALQKIFRIPYETLLKVK
jgi:transcriptional regulator with XRE-family HTH domain